MAIASQLKKNYFWNTLGSLANAVSSALLLIVVTRTLGPYIGGIFSLAYALGQQFQVLGAFEMRPYQATDTTNKYSFGVYLASRFITCGVMLISLAAYALYADGISNDAILLFGIASLKLFDALEDVYHGMFQQKGRLDIAGRAFFFRIIITFITFCFGCMFGKSLEQACLFSFIASAAATVLLNFPFIGQFEQNKPVWNFKEIGKLLLSCFPLFLGVFLANDLINVPRYAIESYLAKSDQTVYAIIYMPALVINLLAGFAFKPLLSTLAESWSKGAFRSFKKIILRGTLLVIVVSLVIFVLAYPFGIPVLSFLYGIDLSPYHTCLLIVLIGGMFNALSVIVYYALVTMRLQKSVLIGYATSALISHILSGVLVGTMGLLGAVILYDLAMGIVFLAFLLFSIRGYKKK